MRATPMKLLVGLTPEELSYLIELADKRRRQLGQELTTPRRPLGRSTAEIQSELQLVCRLKVSAEETLHRPFWHPAETAPMTGQAIITKITTTLRFLPYKPSSAEYRKGKKGRWQEANSYGGWENTPLTPGEWRKA